MKTLNNIKRELRSYGMREAYTAGGSNIIYCGPIAVRLINDYAFETWEPADTSSGTVQYFNSIEEKNNALSDLCLEALGVI